MSLSLLPPELLFHISSFLAPSNPDLAALARVSSSCSAVAHRVLYAHVNLDSASRTGPLNTLANNNQLAGVVRSFAVSLSSLPSPSLLPSALQNMSNLLELDIFLDSPPHSDITSILRSSTSYPFLTRFATSLPWCPDLVQFLNKCPTITQLYLDSPFSASDIPLPHPFLPSLSHFTGPPSLALLLIPHRPVQHIDLTSPSLPSSNPDTQGLSPQLARSLSQSSAPILALAATTSSTAHPQPHQQGQPNNDEDLVTVLTVLAACMGHLRHLRVVTNTFADTFGFGPTMFDHTYFENITDALTSLPDLQSCEIWGFHWVSSDKPKDHASPNFGPTTPRSSWHSPSFNPNIPTSNATTNTNFLDDLYQDLIFPY